MKIEVKGKTYKQITKLDLSNRNLTEVPQEIFQCINLRKLILSNNLINNIPPQIVSLRKLKVLDLSHNKISQLYANVFKLPALETLNISYNSLNKIPHQIKESNIKNLLVQNNLISNIDVKAISELEKLNISYNKLTSFVLKQGDFNLRHLWISDNPIKKFQISKPCVPNLRHIHVYTSEIASDCSLEYMKLAIKKGNSYDVFETLEDAEFRKTIDSINEKKLDIPIASNRPELNSKTDITTTNTPNVGISYSWDDEKHKEWVLNLANELTEKGIFVYLDQFDLKPGMDKNHYMENIIFKSQRVIVILTPNYKLKADKRDGGVGYEYSIITSEIFDSQDENKFIPVLRSGEIDESSPIALKSRIAIFMDDDTKFEDKFDELCREIHHEPKTKRPKLGSKPNY
ncbi:Leucine Rich Repeat [Bacteroides luti]|uniref:Leucine Rich Repeat n=1 Tax=Bacteroides luti TaxID=1297750 RepID=A0A1M4VED1_9BACE|nr:TIR domain-containing protein [Bacteroides luti]SHE67344.1 Leucine Rich Repeat [Bacteroides luti]